MAAKLNFELGTKTPKGMRRIPTRGLGRAEETQEEAEEDPRAPRRLTKYLFQSKPKKTIEGLFYLNQSPKNN